MKNPVHLVDSFDVHHAGLINPFRFSCSGDLDTVGVTVSTYGLSAYETPVTDILIELMKTANGVVLDVGANTGLYALAAAAANRSVQVIAFEPLEPARDLLQRNIALNPELAPRITIEPVGLSNETGSFSFYETINNRGYISTSSSLEQRHAQTVGDEYVKRVIHTITLDSFAQTLGDKTVSFMKIDVEGHEHAVISGGKRFLATHRPIFTIEVLGNSEKSPIDNFLAREDYLAFAMAPGVLHQGERIMFFPDAWNHLLILAEKLKQVFTLCRTLNLRLELS